MPVSYDMPVTLVKHRGFFDYSKLLQAIRKFYVDNEFDTFDIGSYKQKYPTPTGTEHEADIGGSKKMSEYVKFHISVFLRVYNMRDIEIVQDGKKLRLQDGQVQVEVRPKMELDWQKRFQAAGPFKKFMEGLDEFYRKYIIKYKISDYWEDMLMFKSVELAERIKEALGQEVK